MTRTYLSNNTTGRVTVNVGGGGGGGGGGVGGGTVLTSNGKVITVDELYDLKDMIDFMVETDPKFKELYTAWRAKRRIFQGEKK
jgi:hypothetical protein